MEYCLVPIGDSVKPAWLVLAHILRPQGRRGEVLAELLTDFPDRFTGTPRVFLAKPGFAGEETSARSVQVTEFFLPMGKNQGRIVLHLSCCASITDAEGLKGLDVIVPAEERLPVEEDANYISDLLGCLVYDAAGAPPDSEPPGSLVGTVEDVHFPTTPDGTRRLEDAAPLLSVVSPDGAEILIPYVKAYLVQLDLDARRIVMALPEGLVDVNA